MVAALACLGTAQWVASDSGTAFPLRAINFTSVDRPGSKNGFPVHDQKRDRWDRRQEYESAKIVDVGV